MEKSPIFVKVAGSCVVLMAISGAVEQPKPADGIPAEALPVIADNATEQDLLAALRRVSIPLEGKGRPEAERLLREVQQRWILAYADALIERFPASEDLEEAVLARLRALAFLARTDDANLDRLLSLTKAIARSQPSATLAAENDFFAIQAFVWGARRENMPRDMQLRGTVERYEAYLEDHPRSTRRAVVYASLVRNLLEMDARERAVAQFGRLLEEFPDDDATRNARDELLRAEHVGRPLPVTLSTQDGGTLDSGAFSGKVLVVLLRACADHGPAAAEGATEGPLADPGVAVLAVCVGDGRAGSEEKSALRSKIVDAKDNRLSLERMRAYPLPVAYVLDGAGVLRAVGAPESTAEHVRRLLDLGSPAPAEGREAAPGDGR